MKASARVQSFSNFRVYGTRIRAGTDRALDRQGDRALAAIRDLAPVGDGTSGVKPGHMRDTIRRSPVQTYKKGRREVNIGTADPTALFLDQGTLGRRTKQIKQRGRRDERTRELKRRFLRQTAAGRRTGIKPLYFFRKGLRQIGMAPGLVDMIKREVGRSLR